MVSFCGTFFCQPQTHILGKTVNLNQFCDLCLQGCFGLCLSHCPESTAERGRIDHSCLVRGSFLVILSMTMTMTINSNSVLLIHVTSADQHESFEHIQKYCVLSTNNFHSCLCPSLTMPTLLPNKHELTI